MRKKMSRTVKPNMPIPDTNERPILHAGGRCYSFQASVLMLTSADKEKDFNVPEAE